MKKEDKEEKIINIALADDHPMVISGLRNMLDNYPGIELKWEYPDGTQLLKGLEENLPDVLCLDIQMPGITGVELVPLILKQYADLPILALTNLDSVLYIHNMLKYGVKGYLLKTTTQETLIHAIQSVYAGKTFLEPKMQEKLDEFTAKMRREASLKATLTKREKEILKLIVNGDTTKEISEKLHLGYRTVESYRFSILMKLDAKNTAILVKKVIEQGIIE